MKNIKLNKSLGLIGMIWTLFLLGPPQIQAQHDTLCTQFGDVEYTTNMIMTYGGGTGLKSTFQKTDMIIGQPLIDVIPVGIDTIVKGGMYSELAQEPKEPFLTASQGDYPDRVQLNWYIDAFSPNPTEFRIFRDGAFLGKFDANVREFIDFNVQAGEIYNYSIKSVSGTDLESDLAYELGFVNPNGVISGQVKTRNGNPVPNATVMAEPTFNQSLEFDGIDDYVCVSYHDALPTDQFTFTSWVRIGDNPSGESIVDLGSDIDQNWWLRASDAGQPKGVVFGIGGGGPFSVVEQEVAFDADPDEWHHVAAVYNGIAMTLYLDGEFMGSSEAELDTAKTRFSFGRLRNGGGDYFEGGLDDVRIYDRALSQTELLLTKDVTVSSRTEGLVAYWKFDEGQGIKAFDLSDSQLDGFLFGPLFSLDSPELMNAGMTDVDGNYIIEGIDYSQESRFSVIPSKIFYNNYALEFNAADEAYVTLPDFDIPDTATIEFVTLPFDRFSEQSLLSYGSGSNAEFNLYVKQDNYFLTLNGQTNQIASVSGMYDHIALGIDGSSDNVQVYINGADAGIYSYADVGGQWSGERWVVGAQDTLSPNNFYTGLVDEFVVFDTILSQAVIQEHAGLGENGGVDSSDPTVYAYYGFNESDGEEVYDFGPNLMDDGQIYNALYSIVARRQKEEPHAFEPNERKVNLNYSSTSVDQVNFTDISTVSISGAVRYSDTQCYMDSVEIYVNGEPNVPPIFTNKDGFFVADFEPGSNIVLTPVFGEDSLAHVFSPTFFEVRRLNVPVANVLFQNTTKREVVGQIFGGTTCRKSIIPSNLPRVEIKLEALNGCYKDTIIVDNTAGHFVFKNIPPIEVAVAVVGVAHSNSANPMTEFFQSQGGVQLDLSLVEKDTVDFKYQGDPFVEVGDFERNKGFLGYSNLDFGPGMPDSLAILKESFLIKDSLSQIFTNKVRVFEDYSFGENANERCYLDSFSLSVVNGLQETGFEEYKSDSSVFDLKYLINNPNLIFPHEKSLTVTAKVGNKQSAPNTISAIVLGERQNESTIATGGPSKIFGVVHDPPGDGSSATLESGTQSCISLSKAVEDNFSLGGGIDIQYGFKSVKSVGTPFSQAEIDIDNNNSVNLKGSVSRTNANNTELEFCVETVKEISTSDGDDIWGTYADVYFGAALNYEIGFREKLDYDLEADTFKFDKVLTIEPIGFATDFVFSEWQIITKVIPELVGIIEQGEREPGTFGPADDGITKQQIFQAQSDLKTWIETIASKRANQKLAFQDETKVNNITFDAAAGYTETTTRELTGSYSTSTSLNIEEELEKELGFTINNSGTTFSLNQSYSHETTDERGNSSGTTVTTSFTLADDDLNDFYSVDISQNDFKTPDLSQLSNEFKSIGEALDNAIIAQQLSGEYSGTDIEDDFSEELIKGLVSGNNADYAKADVPFIQTPIFRLKGGESMCPWIPGTRNREEVFVQVVGDAIKTNVPTNTPAVFRVKIGNIGPNGVDGLVYEIGVDEGGNPDGALIKMDGQPLISPIEFQFIGTSTVEKTITVEYPGTGTFDFEDLGLYFASVCQLEHSESVGFDLGDGGFLIYDDYSAYGDNSIFNEDGTTSDVGGGTGINYYNRFYKPISLTAKFVEPCSPVDIGFPTQGHVVLPGNEIIDVTLTEFIKSDADLDIIRVQYRPIPGDGAWINIAEIEKEDLPDIQTFMIVPWDMSELKDGNYELRAITDCAGTIGGNLSPGMSEFILVNKETESPKLFGAPEPADGIFTIGDEISITFNEVINCNRVDPFDNLMLVDTESGRPITFSHVCVDDKIVLTIEEQYNFVDGLTLRATAIGVEDLAGNEMAVPVGAPGSPEVNFKSWEFLVDVNPLRWEAGSNIREVKQVDVPMVISRNIMNNSGTARNFVIKGNKILNLDGSVDYEDIPSWVQIEPRSGTLDPGEIMPITFLFPKDLLVDDYLSDMNVVGDDNAGNAISTDLKVRCSGPEWDFDRENDFENTMTFTVQLNIFGDISLDNSDRVAAFIDGELRGSAYVEFVPAFEGIDNNGDGLINDEDVPGAYMAFLTVYGDETDFPVIDFNVFDGSECIIYSEVIEQIDYIPTAQEGIPSNPTVLHVMNVVDRKIPVAEGWTWISVNLDLMDNTTDNVLSSLNYKSGDLIKDDISFADFTSGTWIGSLSDISFEKRYLFYSEEEDTICLTGVPYDPETSTININQGWNWIGFVPQQGMLVDDALSSLMPLEGDIIKSQTAFAQYIPSFGWIGNLNVMEPPHGYLLNISNPGVLDYTSIDNKSKPRQGLNTKKFNPYWDYNTSLYQYNMNIMATIDVNTYDLHEKDQIGVFVDGEIRGIGQAIYVEPIDEYLLFITASGNIPNERLEFILFSERDSTELQLEQTIFFKPDEIVGDINEPFVFSFLSTSSEDIAVVDVTSVKVYPNPSSSFFNIEIQMSENEDVTLEITDALGHRIDIMNRTLQRGMHTLRFKADALPAGIYNLHMTCDNLRETVRMFKIE